MEGRYPKSPRCARGLDDDFFSAIEDLPGIGLMDTRDAARQSGLPAPVLTRESVNLSRFEYEIHAFKRSHTGEGFRDPPDFPQRYLLVIRHCYRTSSSGSALVRIILRRLRVQLLRLAEIVDSVLLIDDCGWDLREEVA